MSSPKEKFHGVYAALLTPFDKRNRVDEKRLRCLVDFLVSKRIDGLYICGGSGECLLMDVNERKLIAEIVKDQVKKRVKVIVHVGGSGNTENAIKLARHAEELNLNGISSIPPYYYGHKFEEVLNYYQSLGDAAKLPLLIYYIPALSGVSISNDRMMELGRIKNIVGLKYANSDLYTLQDLLLKMEGGWLAFSGPDELCLPALTVGVTGCIGTTQNVLPELFISIYRNFHEGNIKEAMECQKRIAIAVSLLLKYGGMASWKSALKARGIDAGYCREPFKKILSPEEEKNFFKEWENHFPEFSEGIS